MYKKRKNISYESYNEQIQILPIIRELQNLQFPIKSHNKSENSSDSQKIIDLDRPNIPFKFSYFDNKNIKQKLEFYPGKQSVQNKDKDHESNQDSKTIEKYKNILIPLLKKTQFVDFQDLRFSCKANKTTQINLYKPQATVNWNRHKQVRRTYGGKTQNIKQLKYIKVNLPLYKDKNLQKRAQQAIKKSKKIIQILHYIKSVNL